MVAFAIPSPDLRPALTRALIPTLLSADLSPSMAQRVMAFLLAADSAITRIDAGERYILVSPVGFIGDLLTAEGVATFAPKVPHQLGLVGIDLAPLLASVRAAVAECN